MVVCSAARRIGSLTTLALALTLAAGCPKKTATLPTEGRPAERTESGAFADTNPWLLRTTDPAANRGGRGIFLGNGFLGATFGAQGVAGKDSRCYVAGLYDDNETLQKIPLWNELALPPIAKGEDYEQTLDMRRGVLSTRWRDPDRGDIEVTSFVSAETPNLAVIRVDNFEPALPPTVQQDGVKIAYRKLKQLGANSWAILVQVLRPNDKPLIPEPTYQEALRLHTSVWEARWQGRDIAIEGDPEAQQLVHKLLFDLFQSTRVGATDSIAPESLSGEFYKGHIFWDADVWMFPALLAQNPQLARSILDYRFKNLAVAKKNAKALGYKGADFPWESARSGREVAPGGFSEGRHVTAGVGWSHWQYYLATGDRVWLEKRGWPVISAVADYFCSRAKKDENGAYHIAKVNGPDELHMGVTDNGYTNAMAAACLRAASTAADVLGKNAPENWSEVLNALQFVRDPKTGVYLRCAGDDGKPGTKQADGELMIWPAQLPMTPELATKTFDFHAKRPIPTGPAMTDSVHALIQARLGRAKEADTEFRNSYRPFIRGPFLLYSEKRTMDRTVFTTGAGGVLQAIYYGFGGLDWAHWNDVTAGKPTLPPSWKKLTITGIAYRGKRWTLTVTPKGKTLMVPGEEPTPSPSPTPGSSLRVGRRDEDSDGRPSRRRRRRRTARTEDSVDTAPPTEEASSEERPRRRRRRRSESSDEETPRRNSEEETPRRRRTRRSEDGGGERRPTREGGESGGESGGRTEGGGETNREGGDG